jgi:membrane protease YdiL (CAAX protease family)
VTSELRSGLPQSLHHRIESPEEWWRLLLGLVAIFTLFQWSASALGSDRGQAGMSVGALVVGATLVVERACFRKTLPAGARAIGFAASDRAGLAVAGAIAVLLLMVVPVFAWARGASIAIEAGALWLLPGLFAQGGIAEEVVFRGYLFGHLRSGRSFWRAAALSMLPFVGVHLLLFLTMPWPVALAALVLAVVLSFPLAHLFELGGATIWAPALLHFVIQATVKVLVISGDGASLFPFVWMAASAAVPMLVLLVPRPPTPSLSVR